MKSRETYHNLAKEYNNIVRKNTMKGYIKKMKTVFKAFYIAKDDVKTKSAIYQFFDLIRESISEKNYADPVNIDRIITNDISKLCSIFMRFKYTGFNLSMQRPNPSQCLMKLCATSLHILHETRVREKHIIFPEFHCLYEYFQKSHVVKSQIVNFTKVFIIYVVSKIETVISTVIALRNEIAKTQNNNEERTHNMTLYRFYAREALISAYFLSIGVRRYSVRNYILLSRLEYSYLCMNPLSCSETPDIKSINPYNVSFLLFATFDLRFDFYNLKSSKRANGIITLSYINENGMLNEMFYYDLNIFKAVLKENITKLFDPRISRLAQFGRLLNVIYHQIDSLSSENLSSTMHKIHVIYKFVRYHLLVNVR
ncbi:hypothetical protein THOM_1469 [Trachipleistophora hominis]|uniref:Uncharacterized protein n=1 Tax=Trachipleistophora hominis TaxID=72359 RepID=L7JX27_TRAHO|nr:hypothetical protein THOM_1469 [Trachipleistophora hominis]